MLAFFVLTCSNSIRYMFCNQCMSLDLPLIHHTPKRRISATFPPIFCAIKHKIQVATPHMRHLGVRFTRASEINNYSDLNNSTRNGFRINDIFGYRHLPLLRRWRDPLSLNSILPSSCPKKTRLPHAYRRATSFFWPLFFYHSCASKRSYISLIEHFFRRFLGQNPML